MLDMKKGFQGHWLAMVSHWCHMMAVALMVAVPAWAGLPLEQWQTANGTKVMFVGTSAIPVIDVSVEFDAGSRLDPAGKSGLAALTNSMLEKGIAAGKGWKEMDEPQIMDAFADAGAIQSGKVSMDRGGYRLRVLSGQKRSDEVVQMMIRFLAHPAFPADVLKREKAIMTASIKEELTRPQNIGSRAFQKMVYGSHPYGQNPTEVSVAAISRKDLVDFHRRYYVADRAVIGIVGDLTRKQAETMAENISAQLPVSSCPMPVMPEVPVQAGGNQVLPHPASQAHVFKGMAAVKRGDPDFFAMTVGNYILGGGGFSSRLMDEVREKRGLTYGVSSSFQTLVQPGPYIIGLSTEKSQVNDALAVVDQTLQAFLDKGPISAEMEAAKSHLTSSFVMNMEGNRKILELITMVGTYNLPMDYLDTWTDKIQAVTADDVRQAFGRKLSAEKMATVVVGN